MQKVWDRISSTASAKEALLSRRAFLLYIVHIDMYNNIIYCIYIYILNIYIYIIYIYIYIYYINLEPLNPCCLPGTNFSPATVGRFSWLRTVMSLLHVCGFECMHIA